LQNVFIEFQKLGISNVSIVKLEHSEIEQYRKDVKVLAINAAKDKAEMLAIAINQKIGKAIYVQEADNLNHIAISNLMQGRVAGVTNSNVTIRSSSSANLNDIETDIEFEKIKIESTFLVRFAL
jgi:uncharacterized protein YggE